VRIIEGDSDAVGNVVIETEWPNDLPNVSVDGDQIRQVLWNIILNGLQAMNGSGTLTVRIQPESSEYVSLDITDTGGGIPQEELSRVFEPFHTTKPRGTGLGLAIARRIIQGHDGSIQIKSRVGEGTTVSISLPTDNVNALTESTPR
ncbi:MAG TPA: PAS domain-containing sensor histidine kinase, partial [Firmicutes bacterium]|nr:PAS domain-containing sensor histidine kinase [Bacillota bacterium]